MTGRRSPWPPELGPDTAHDRARVISRGWRDVAIRWATAYTQLTGDPQATTELAAMEAMCVKVGEGGWQFPTPAPVAGEWMTRDQVAIRGGVRPDVVSGWCGRGLTRNGEHRTLTRYPEGYHPDEVDAFLQWRDERRRTPTRKVSAHG